MVGDQAVRVVLELFAVSVSLFLSVCELFFVITRHYSLQMQLLHAAVQLL